MEALVYTFHLVSTLAIKIMLYFIEYGLKFQLNHAPRP